MTTTRSRTGQAVPAALLLLACALAAPSDLVAQTSPPGEVTNLVITGGRLAVLSWDVVPGATSYDVLSSASPDPNDTLDFKVTSYPGPPQGDAFLPAPGQVRFYLVRARIDAAIGTWGTRSDGTVRAVRPVLLITAPAEGSLLIEAQPTIGLAYNDDTGIDTGSLELRANGAVLTASCTLGAVEGSCVPALPLPDGPVTLAASIRDLEGNTVTRSVQITIDTQPASVRLTAPADGLITRDGSVAASGTVGPDVASVQVNGVPAALSGSGFAASVPLREGTNMIVALATKTSGRTGTDTVEVTRDLVAPIVRITSPRDGFVSAEAVVAVTGQVNDIVSGGTDPRVLVNGVEATVAGGTFMVMDLPLVRGPNQLEAVTTDAVGNEGRHAISVTFQRPAGARIVVESGNGQSGPVRQPLAQPLVVAVRDSLGNPVAGRIVEFRVSRNNGTLRAGPKDPPLRSVQLPTDGSGRTSARFTLGDTAGEGNNRVAATALGVAGEVEFCATGLAAPPQKILMVTGDNQRGTVGQPLAAPFEALVVDRDGNPLPGIDVTFEVVGGTGNLNGAPSLVRTTGGDGLARAVLTLGPDAGINNNVVSARFDGLAGLPANFRASGLLPGNPAATRFSGVVLDNSHTSIPGARVTIPGTPVAGLTDSQGMFLLESVPVGHIHLRIDPSTSPRPETFPPLEFETVTVAGQLNTLGQPILIPPLDLPNARVVGGPQDVTLRMEGVAGLELTVFANSARFADGSRTGIVSISQVHLDKVPMPPPSGTIFMPPAWTVQPAGVSFDPPARISIPNDGLPPGRVIDIFQFDHDLNQFVNVGRGTVSDDGLVIVSDPGFGITRAGWGGCGQPQPPTTCAAKCGPCEKCENNACVPDPAKDGMACEDTSPNFNVACSGSSVKVQIDSSCRGSCNAGACQNKPFGINSLKGSVTSAINAVCDSCVMDPLKAKMIDNLDKKGLVLKCAGELTSNPGACAEAGVGGNTATIAGRSVTAGEPCATVSAASTILHEMVHAHGERPDDQVTVDCETSCFTAVTRGGFVGNAAGCK